MISLDKIIADLLIQHNCVIVPGFGGFVAKEQSARIDHTRGIMIPPSKSVLFNSKLTNNDGLIISEYKELNKLTYSHAEAVINDSVIGWKSHLDSGLRVEIDRVGHLYKNSEEKICFEQDRSFNLLLSAFGLGNVVFIPESAIEEEHELLIAGTEPQEVKIIELAGRPKTDVIGKDATVLASVAPKRKSKTFRYVAAACLLPIAFYSIWIPVKTDVLESRVLSLKDFNPFTKTEAPSYVERSTELGVKTLTNLQSFEATIASLPDDVAVCSYKISEEKYVLINLHDADPTDNPPQVTENQINAQPDVVEANAMNFIVGCFGDKANAENLVKKLRGQGMDARVVDNSGGLHRVTAGSSISEEAMNEIISTAKGLGYDGWVLK